VGGNLKKKQQKIRQGLRFGQDGFKIRTVKKSVKMPTEKLGSISFLFLGGGGFRGLSRKGKGEKRHGVTSGKRTKLQFGET